MKKEKWKDQEIKGKIFVPYSLDKQNKQKNTKHIPYYISTGYPSVKSHLPDAFLYYFIVLLISATTPRG